MLYPDKSTLQLVGMSSWLHLEQCWDDLLVCKEEMWWEKWELYYLGHIPCWINHIWPPLKHPVYLLLAQKSWFTLWVSFFFSDLFLAWLCARCLVWVGFWFASCYLCSLLWEDCVTILSAPVFRTLINMKHYCRQKSTQDLFQGL